VTTPREIYIRALGCGAAKIVLVHNHPSGCPHPSKEDILLTERVFEAGKIIGITLVDHIVVGNPDHFSFAQEGYIK
jgi:DNA repair protein RadC